MPRKAKGNTPQSETKTPGTETRKGHLALVSPAPVGTTPIRTRQRSGINLETGLTEKQEAFVQGIVSGKTLSDAYRDAYDCRNMQATSVHTNACKLFSDAKVSRRIKTIVDDLAEKRRMLAPSDAELALKVLREKAAKADTDASQIRAAELLAKAAGVFTEQVEITDKSGQSEEEIEARIRQRLARVNLTG